STSVLPVCRSTRSMPPANPCPRSWVTLVWISRMPSSRRSGRACPAVTRAYMSWLLLSPLGRRRGPSGPGRVAARARRAARRRRRPQRAQVALEIGGLPQPRGPGGGGANQVPESRLRSRHRTVDRVGDVLGVRRLARGQRGAGRQGRAAVRLIG